MIVANVVPRPPRSSYNLLNLRDCGSVGDLVYRVLDLVVDACGVVSCGEPPNRCGDGEVRRERRVHDAHAVCVSFSIGSGRGPREKGVQLANYALRDCMDRH